LISASRSVIAWRSEGDYPRTLVSDCRSVLGGCSRFGRCCYLV